VHLSALFRGQFEFNYVESTTKKGAAEYELFHGSRVGTHARDFLIMVPIEASVKNLNELQSVTLTISLLELNGKPLKLSGPNQEVRVVSNSNSGA